MTIRRMGLPLQIRYQAAYQALVDVLKRQGLDVYDVLTTVVCAKNGTCTLDVRFGSDFYQSEQYTLAEESLIKPDAELIEFFERVSSVCHDTLKAEYRTYMRNT
ncbi:hypothetical protein [Alicyclobacillus mengziensis]|uniref:Uncharacterized protein n=1 Tax=Alicyclobacillus mengziensis TaxID=2931921 RepID=A0A9X7Z5W4_9BACL|nr:hypothetical protein [Alicyclobacillus mengziensis]QSO45588.1 hypothetical protein JZ786_13540 [Alicyclobacillus mengziensis]